MESWTVTKFSTVLNVDSRRVAKALAMLDAGRDKAREVWPIAEGMAAIFAEMNGKPIAREPSPADCFWSLRLETIKARDSVAGLDCTDATKKRMDSHLAAVWTEIVKLTARYEAMDRR